MHQGGNGPRASEVTVEARRRESSNGDGRRFTNRISAENRSVPQLLRELSQEGADLVRQEFALAKAEMEEKVTVFRRSSVSMAIGGALLLASLLVFVLAVNYGLTALFAQFMALDIAVWLAPLILAAVLAAVGWGVFKGGKERMQEEGLEPHDTRETLEEDQIWARRKVHEVKEEMRHG